MPKSYGLVYWRPSAVRRFVSEALMCASMLVSPLRMSFRCHTVNEPSAMKVAVWFGGVYLFLKCMYMRCQCRDE